MFPSISAELLDLGSKFEKLREISQREGLPGSLKYEDFVRVCISFRDFFPDAMPLLPKYIEVYAKTFPWVVRAGGLSEDAASSYLEKLMHAGLFSKEFRGRRYFIPNREFLRSNIAYINC